MDVRCRGAQFQLGELIVIRDLHETVIILGQRIHPNTFPVILAAATKKQQ